MELKKIYFFIFIILFNSELNGETIAPNNKLLPYDVVKIQLEALKNNNKDDDGAVVTTQALTTEGPSPARGG